MADLSSVLKNTFFAAVGRISQPFCSVLLTLVALKFLGPERFGSYAFAIGYYFTFQLVSSIGLKTLLTREIAKEESRLWRELGTGASLTLPFSLAVSAAAIGYLRLSSVSDVTESACLILIAAIPFAAMIDLFEASLGGLSRFRFLAISTTAENILRVGASTWLLLEGYGVIPLAIVFAGARVAQFFALGTFILVVSGRPSVRVTWSHVRELIIAVRPFFLAMVAVSLFWRVGALILQEAYTETEVGYYDTVFRFVNVVILALQALIAVVFPMLSRRFVDNPDTVRPVAASVIKGAVLVTVPACLGIAMIAPLILEWLGKWEPALEVVPILCWVPIPYAISVVQAHILLATGQQRVDLWCNVAATAFLIAIAFWAIPQWGAVGYAWTLLIGLTALVAIQAPYVRLWPSELFQGGRPVLLLLALAIVFSLAFLPVWHPFIRVTSTLGAYAALLVLINPLNERERESLKAVILRRRSSAK